jgi:hypothetical protein
MTFPFLEGEDEVKKITNGGPDPAVGVGYEPSR